MTARRAMTPARKRRIHEARDGVCYHCNLPVPVAGPDVRYDHRIGYWLRDADDDSDLWPVHLACDKKKTAADQGKIAKVKRLIRDADPETRKRSKRPLTSRGFDKGLRKKMDGTVVRRTPHDRRNQRP